MRLLKILCLFVLAASFVSAQEASSQSKEAIKPIPEFEASQLDRSVNPCDNFYQFACGGWKKNNPIPPDQVVWGRFNELAEHNRAILRDILEKASDPNAKRDDVERRIGDYYAACMDEKAVNAKGLAPLKDELARIDAMKTPGDIATEVARIHDHGFDALFNFGSDQDFKNASMMIAEIDQGGLGLPDRDYYIEENERMTTIRKQYLDHVQKMLELMGEKPEQAAADAKTVMAMETQLAKASMDRTARRDPNNDYHKMSKQEFLKIVPDFQWNAYFTGVNSTSWDSLNVVAPDFFKQMQAMMKSEPIANWKTYLHWHVVHSAAPYLSSDFVDENFKFYGKELTGAKELRARWKRCVSQVDQFLGEDLGQKYVERTFGPEGKERTIKNVQALEKALHNDIQNLDWMSPETKKKAIEKLDAIALKIGYPDKWRDYSSIRISRDDLVGDAERSGAFEEHRQLNKIGKPVDLKEWEMTPPTVNAYYSPQHNDINFPAGILQPPFFDKSGDDALNFGGIGAVIGHELTHGFDDEGSQFDAKGNLNNWWTEQDRKKFDERTACIADEYSGFTAVDDTHLNGKLTLGENTADNGGLRIAYMALMDTLGGEQKAMDGFTPAQRVFLGWAGIWCQNQTPEIAAVRVKTDPHSPGEYRVNGVLQNMPEFQKAFSCKAGDKMVSAKPCHVW